MRRADRERGRTFAADDGVATVLSAVLSLALLAVAWFGYQLGAVVLARHRAEGAADLAALAAAAQVVRGQDSACERASRVTHEMRVRLADCRVDGRDARVCAAAEPPGVPLHLAVVRARARAGPVSGPGISPTTSPANGAADNPATGPANVPMTGPVNDLATARGATR